MSEQEQDPLIFLQVRLDYPQSSGAILNVKIPFLREDIDGIEAAKERLTHLVAEILHEQYRLPPPKEAAGE